MERQLYQEVGVKKLVLNMFVMYSDVYFDGPFNVILKKGKCTRSLIATLENVIIKLKWIKWYGSLFVILKKVSVLKKKKKTSDNFTLNLQN